MIVNLFHVTVPTEHAGPFERSWTQRAGLVDAMAGFRGMEVLRDGNKPGHYIVLTRWETREHFDAWVNSPAFIGGHARTNAGEAGNASGGDLEFYDVIPSTPIDQPGTGSHTH